MFCVYHRTASARRWLPALLLVSIGGVSGFCGGNGRGALVKNRTTTATTTTKTTTTTTPPPLSGHPVLRCGEQTGKKSLSLSLYPGRPLPPLAQPPTRFDRDRRSVPHRPLAGRLRCRVANRARGGICASDGWVRKNDIVATGCGGSGGLRVGGGRSNGKSRARGTKRTRRNADNRMARVFTRTPVLRLPRRPGSPPQPRCCALPVSPSDHRPSTKIPRSPDRSPYVRVCVCVPFATYRGRRRRRQRRRR